MPSITINCWDLPHYYGQFFVWLRFDVHLRIIEEVYVKYKIQSKFIQCSVNGESDWMGEDRVISVKPMSKEKYRMDGIKPHHSTNFEMEIQGVLYKEVVFV